MIDNTQELTGIEQRMISPVLASLESELCILPTCVQLYAEKRSLDDA